MNTDMGNNNENRNSNNNNGINLSNLFNLKRLGNMFGLNTQNRNGMGVNPLAGLSKLFSGNGNNNSRYMNRCNVRVLPIEEAYRRIKTGGVFLVDVRTDMEYRTLKIKGSVNIPLDRLQSEVMNIIPNKEENIMLYCSTGSRVRRAIQILWSMGYNNIYIWEGAGLNTFAFQDLIVYNDNRNRTEYLKE